MRRVWIVRGLISNTLPRVLYRVIVEQGNSDTIGSDMLALFATQGYIPQDQLQVRTIDSGEHSAHGILEDHAV